MRRYQYLAAIITLWWGIYFAFDFAPPSVPVFGAGDVFFLWGWDRIKKGLEECAIASLPPACLFDFAKLTVSVPGLLVRLAICLVGSAVAATSFQVLRRLRDDAEQKDE